MNNLFRIIYVGLHNSFPDYSINLNTLEELENLFQPKRSLFLRIMILVYFSEYEKTILPPPKRISTSETYYTSKLIVFPNCQFLILSNVRLRHSSYNTSF